MKSHIYIRGTRLYVEEYNESAKEALLYLHGGPGSSCIDFCYYQAIVLAKELRVVAIDQRGVLRSDPIHTDEQFGINDIIDDCEALRNHLGINRWTILGHSFGGHVAFRYALRFPNVVKKVIFESPCFDARSSMMSLISGALYFFQSIEHQIGINECNKYIKGSYQASELWNAWGKIGQLLGEKRDQLYFYGIHPSTYNAIINNSIVSKGIWDKNQIHAEKLQDEGKLFENLITEFPKLSQPSILLAGLFDLVCCEEQQLAYKQKVNQGKLVIFERSGHFPRIEEPEKYTYEVLKFIYDEQIEEGRGIS